jgi:hypothetical protein
MARIVGGTGASHSPTIGQAKSRLEAAEKGGVPRQAAPAQGHLGLPPHMATSLME